MGAVPLEAAEWAWSLTKDGRYRGRVRTSVEPFTFEVRMRATKTPGAYEVQGSITVDGYTLCTRFERHTVDLPTLTPDAVIGVVDASRLADECLKGAASLLRRAFDAVRVTDL